MKENKFKQVMKNLDTFRTGKPSHLIITDEQKEFLIACRENPMPVSWDKVATLWEEIGWGTISSTAVRGRYRLIKAK